MTAVLVLGRTGSIGRLVVRRLLELGDQARVLTRNPIELVRRSEPALTSSAAT